MPFGVLDTQSVGRQTREGSRTLEVSCLLWVNDDWTLNITQCTVCFRGLRGPPSCFAPQQNRRCHHVHEQIARTSFSVSESKQVLTTSQFYRNVWDSSVVSDGYHGKHELHLIALAMLIPCQVSHKSAARTDRLLTLVPSTVHQSIPMSTESARCKETTWLASMSHLLGNTAGETNPRSRSELSLTGPFTGSLPTTPLTSSS